MMTNHTEICQLVDKIIAGRHAQLPIIAQQRQNLTELLNRLNLLDTQETADCRRIIHDALAVCNKLEQRFSRDSIHICVVGKERSGKSRFLQNLYSLSDSVNARLSTTDCTFGHEKSTKSNKITLIDAAGQGIPEDTLDGIYPESDAIVFQLLPLSPAGGFLDVDTAEIYSTLLNRCPGKNLDKQLFWLINEAPHTSRALCELCAKALNDSGWHGAMTAIVNIDDQNQVREEFLIPMLNTVTANLYDIDSLYASDLTAALEAVRNACSSIHALQLPQSLSYHFI